MKRKEQRLSQNVKLEDLLFSGYDGRSKPVSQVFNFGCFCGFDLLNEARERRDRESEERPPRIPSSRRLEIWSRERCSFPPDAPARPFDFDDDRLNIGQCGRRKVFANVV